MYKISRAPELRQLVDAGQRFVAAMGTGEANVDEKLTGGFVHE